MTWAIEQKIVTDPTARHVLLCMANYADKQGRNCWASVPTIAADTGLSERAVQMKQDQLLAMGVIELGNQAVVAAEVKRADRRPKNYNLLITRGAPDSPSADANGVNVLHRVEPERGERGAPGEKSTGCNSFANGVNVVRERGERGAPNPLKTKPSVNRETGQAPLPEKSEAAKAFEHYAALIAKRYGQPAAQSARIRGQFANLVSRIPAEDIAGAISAYVGSSEALYVRSMHCVDLLLRDIEKHRLLARGSAVQVSTDGVPIAAAPKRVCGICHELRGALIQTQFGPRCFEHRYVGNEVGVLADKAATTADKARN